jgi:hypothetical protein
LPIIPPDATWAENADTVAGGFKKSTVFNQLDHPRGLYVDNNETIFIVDYGNHRILE